MRRGAVRLVLVGATTVLAAAVLQTALFSTQVKIVGVSPEFVLVVVLVAAQLIEAEQLLLLAFSSGLLLDLLGSGVLGLRALVYTAVGFVAVRLQTRTQGSLPALAVAVGGLSLLAAILHTLLATIFEQPLVADRLVTALWVTPLLNIVMALAFWPLASRLSRAVLVRVRP